MTSCCHVTSMLHGSARRASQILSSLPLQQEYLQTDVFSQTVAPSTISTTTELRTCLEAVAPLSMLLASDTAPALAISPTNSNGTSCSEPKHPSTSTSNPAPSSYAYVTFHERPIVVPSADRSSFYLLEPYVDPLQGTDVSSAVISQHLERRRADCEYIQAGSKRCQS